MKYLVIALGIVAILAAGVAALQTKRLESALEDIATEKANVVTLKDQIIKVNETVARLEVQRAQDQASINTLSDRANLAETEKNRAIGKLTQIQKRLSSAAIKKPGLVGRLATRATSNVLRQFFDASGGPKPSSGNPAIPSPAPRSNSADKPEIRGSDAIRDKTVE